MSSSPSRALGTLAWRPILPGPGPTSGARAGSGGESTWKQRSGCVSVDVRNLFLPDDGVKVTGNVQGDGGPGRDGDVQAEIQVGVAGVLIRNHLYWSTLTSLTKRSSTNENRSSLIGDDTSRCATTSRPRAVAQYGVTQELFVSIGGLLREKRRAGLFREAAKSLARDVTRAVRHGRPCAGVPAVGGKGPPGRSPGRMSLTRADDSFTFLPSAFRRAA